MFQIGNISNFIYKISPLLIILLCPADVPEGPPPGAPGRVAQWGVPVWPRGTLGAPMAKAQEMITRRLLVFLPLQIMPFFWRLNKLQNVFFDFCICFLNYLSGCSLFSIFCSLQFIKFLRRNSFLKSFCVFLNDTQTGDLKKNFIEF